MNWLILGIQLTVTVITGIYFYSMLRAQRRSEHLLRFRDGAFHAYFSNPAYIGMITERFGPEVAAHIRNAGSTRLRRQLLE